jgi:tetratricopeptide (TPR) repeat protein
VAFCLSHQGRFARATSLFQKALALRRALLPEAHGAVLRGYQGLATVLDHQGKYAEARPLHEKEVELAVKVFGETHPSTASACNRLAVNLNHQDRHADALRWNRKALAAYRSLYGDDHPETAAIHQNIGSCFYLLGQYRQASDAWKASLPGFEVGRQDSASSGFGRSEVRALDFSPRAGLAVALAHRGEFREAWRFAEESLARGLLDDLAREDDPADRSLRDQLDQHNRRLVALYAVAKPSPDQARLREELIRQCHDLVGRLRKQSARRSLARVRSLEDVQKHLPPDAALVFWLGPMGDQWACVLRRRGQPRWQRLAGSGAKGAWSAADALLPSRLHSALGDLDVSGERRGKLLATMRQRWLGPVLEHLEARDSLPAVRRLFVIPTDRMALVPVEVLVPEYTVSYVPSGSVLARLAETHRALAGSSLLALGDPVFSAPRKPLAPPPGHGLLVRMVVPGSQAKRAGLQAGDVLLKFGDTPLKSLADLRGALGRKDATTMTYWRNGDRKDVALVAGPLGLSFDPRPVGEALSAWRKAEQFRVEAAYAPLPGTRFEVQALERLVGEKRATLLLGSRAREQALDELAGARKLRLFRLVHLATHGEIDLQRPERSALVLSRDSLGDAAERAGGGQKVHDGHLRIGTILRDWDLDADLVVLSACNTGLGKSTVGDGLIGFAHAFLQKGARSVVLSRWKVNDTATALLMVRFYENLLGKRKDLKAALGRAEALAEAKKWLQTLPRKQVEDLASRLSGGVLRGTEKEVKPLVKGKPAKLPEGERPFAHPYYWAAFVLVGDPS